MSGHEQKPRPRTYGKQPLAPASDSHVMVKEETVHVPPALDTLNKSQLMQIARDNHLSAKGKKQDILDRLIDAGVE